MGGPHTSYRAMVVHAARRQARSGGVASWEAMRYDAAVSLQRKVDQFVQLDRLGRATSADFDGLSMARETWQVFQ